MLKTATIACSAYSTHKMNFPAALDRSIRNLILHHLDDTALKWVVSMNMVVEFHQANPCTFRACSIDRRKACISLLSNHVFKPLWSILVHPILSHIIDSLRSASMRLSDDCSLHSSIPHRTTVQPALVTKSYHYSQIWFVFQNLLIGVCVEMPRSQWIAVCIDSIKKMICISPDGL